MEKAKRYIQNIPFKYECEDEYFYLHTGDKMLPEVKIPLPKFTGDITKVYNYGLEPEQQYYPYEVIPQRVKNIEAFVREAYQLKENVVVHNSLIKKFLQDNQIEFREEIDWCQRVLHHRFHGQWVLINGKLTYIHRWNYVFVNFWFCDNESNPARDGYPDYRDRQRRFFSACGYYHTDTTAVFPIMVTYETPNGHQQSIGFGKMSEANQFVKNKSKQGAICVISEGSFVIDMKTRTCYGVLYYKHRREGATYMAQCIGYCIATEGKNRHTATQSKSDTHAQEVYDQKLIEPLKRLPFCLLPDFKPGNGTNRFPTNKVEFQATTKKRNIRELSSSCGVFPAGEYQLDGSKWYFVHHDEIGKKDSASRFSVVKRYNVTKAALGVGAGKKIIGWYMGTSTIGEMEGDGGTEALELAKQSMPNRVSNNGQTNTGLKIIFFNALDGLQGFIDEYGMSVIEDPIEPIMGIDGTIITMGSRRFVENTIAEKEANQDWNGLNEFIRQHPRQFSDCFRASSQDSQFNVEKIERTLEALAIQNIRHPQTLRYDFHFTQGWGSPVDVQEDPMGRWSCSRLPEVYDRNQYILTQEGLQPAVNVIYRRFGGFDPMKNQKKNVIGKKMSNGAGAIYRPYDPITDNNKHIQDWEGGKFEAVYNFREEDKYVYAEQMAAACVLYGAMAYPEMNFDLIAAEFQRNNMASFLLYDSDPVTGEWKSAPGANSTNAGIKDDLWASGRNWVNKYCEYEKQREVLEEFRDIKNPEEMTDFDLFTACLFALRGSESNTVRFSQQERQVNVSLERFFPTFNYNQF